MYIFKMFFVPWIITLVVEIPAAVLWGVRNRKGIWTVFWINTLTNISVTGFRLLANQTVPSAEIRTVITIILEILVLLSEWGLIRKFLKDVKHPFCMSLLLNALSYAAGCLAPFIYIFLKKIGI